MSDRSSWQKLLDSIQQPTGYCALRYNRGDKSWWLDPSTFGLSAVEVRQKVRGQDQRTESNKAFADKNPAHMILEVKLEIV